MKTYPLARRSSIHVYVAETEIVNPEGEIFADVGTSVSREREYELTGNYPDEEYEKHAKELIDFIRPYSCRRSLNVLFEELGKEILKDLERISYRESKSEDAEKRKSKFKERAEKLRTFLDDFEGI